MNIKRFAGQLATDFLKLLASHLFVGSHLGIKMKRRQSVKQKEVKIGSVKPVRGKRPVKRRGVGGRDVTIGFRGKIIKMASQRKNERDLTIYTEQMLYLQKLIFNIRVRREIRNVADMMEFNWAYADNAAQTKKMMNLPLPLQILTFPPDKSRVWAKGYINENFISDI